MTWSQRPAQAPQSSGKGGSRHWERRALGSRYDYDCSYSGSLGSGAYAVKAKGRYGPAKGPRADAGVFSAGTITAPVTNARMTFRNTDAKSASITATAVTAVPTMVVKVYKFESKTDKGRNGHPDKTRWRKRPVLKAAPNDPRLAAVPLEPDTLYTVQVRGSTATLTADGAEEPATDSAGAASAPIPDVVLSIIASDQASPYAVSASTGAAGSSSPAPPPGDSGAAE
jgi:hypothetical protein